MVRPRALFALPIALVLASAGCGGDEFEASPGAGGTFDAGNDVDASDAADPPDTKPDNISVEDVGTDTDPSDAPQDVLAEASDGPVETGKSPLGAACTDGPECETGVCDDGVCCGKTCGPCMVCNAQGDEGTCMPAPDGTNPEEVCGAPGEPCSGSCDGNGGCAFPPDGIPCGDPLCETEVDLLSFVCDGLGGCDPRPTPCTPFACDPAVPACFTSCASNPEACAADAYCDGSVCIGKLALGEPCADPGMCSSGECVDGVCCDGPCSADCESCNQGGVEGSCTAYEPNQDPELDCTGDPGCEGTCDGASACVFPASTVPCGNAYCDAANAQRDPRCNGDGACVEIVTECDLFLCDSGLGACPSSCVNHAGCIPEAYCETNACHAKKDNAELCDQAYECTSSHCEDTSNERRCCNTACPLPLDCVTGECLCQGMSCPSGEDCIQWFRDLDDDDYGDPAVSELGCEGSPPKDVNDNEYVDNMDDCYDHNPQANPDQTAFFDVDRGDGSFDWNCDQIQEKRYDDTVTMSAQCKDCKNWDCKSCGYFSTVYGTYAYTCQTPCGPEVWQSFKQGRQCGETGTLFSCNHASGVCTPTELTQPNTVQGCR